MSRNSAPSSAISAYSPFSIYTIRDSDFLATAHKRGGEGEFTETRRWTSARELFHTAQKTGQILPVLIASANTITGVIYTACIDDLRVSPRDKNGNGTTIIRFSELQPLRPKRPLSALVLKSSGQPLSDNFIKPYAICHTPNFLPPIGSKQRLGAQIPSDRRRNAPSAQAALQLCTFKHGDAPKPGEGLRIGTTRRPPRGATKKEWPDYFDVWFPVLAPSAALLRRCKSSQTMDYNDFCATYERELLRSADSRQAIDLLAALALRTSISIGCYCADESTCHRKHLRKLIERAARKL